MLVHLGVLLGGHHVDEGCGRRVLDDENRVPPGLFAVADDDRRRRAAVADGGADAFEVRRDLPPVAQVALQATRA